MYSHLGCRGWKRQADGLVLETLEGARGRLNPRRARLLRGEPGKMRRCCKNVLAPINKLFTHYLERRAHSQRRATPTAPCLQGTVLLRRAALGWEAADQALRGPRHWLIRLDMAEQRENADRADTAEDPKSACSPPSPTAAGRSLLHTCCSPTHVPLTEDMAASGPAAVRRGEAAKASARALGSRRTKPDPHSHRSWQSLSCHPHLETYPISGPTPEGVLVISSFS